MTQDETDDDRMERADRIREMREGRRSRPDEDADDGSDDASPSDGPADGSTDQPTDGPADEPTDSSAASDPGGNGAATGAEANTGVAVEADDAAAVDESGFEFDGDAGSERADDDTDASTAGNGQAVAETRTGVAGAVSDADARDAVSQLGTGGTFAIPDQATTVSADDDTLDAEQTVAAARAAAAAGRRTATAGDRTRVLEFVLGDERFCLDIEYVEEIVELENLTRVPNSPSYVEGVVDLRGQVTAIINPKDALNVSNDRRGDLIVVFDSEQFDEQGHLGWVVDEVRQVTPVSEEEVNESPDEEQDHVNGIINREDEDDFIVWTTPELALHSS